MSTATERILEVPNNTITYFGNGKVQRIDSYTNVNGWTIASHTYERIGGLLLHSAFDEHHEVCFNRRQVLVQDLPKYVRELFEANSREDVQRMREEGRLPLRYVDAN